MDVEVVDDRMDMHWNAKLWTDSVLYRRVKSKILQNQQYPELETSQECQ